MIAFWASLTFVVLAEMGDKTQLLAMAFASRILWQTVMWGVFWATAANHLLAVLVGNYLTHIVPMMWIQCIAAVAVRPGKVSASDCQWARTRIWHFCRRSG